MTSSLKIVLRVQGSIALLVSPSLQKDLTPEPSNLTFNEEKWSNYDFYQ